MAQGLDNGLFYLPSEFLTDQDIIMEFASSSDISTDDDYLLPKPFILMSTSPQSTLFGCDCNQTDSTQETPRNENYEKETLDLLNKAADEVAKMKDSRRNIGTGFFDCSKTAKRSVVNKEQLFPPPPFFPPPFYSQPQFSYFPHQMMWGQVQLPSPPPARNVVTKNNAKITNSSTISNNSSKTSHRSLGLPQSPWPALPGQAQPQPKAQPMTGVSVGTGVFLPRQVALEHKKKSDGNTTKTKNAKGSQRRNSRPTKAKVDEIQLPSDWVY